MGEILFRGKRVDNGEWVEGSLITDVFYRVGEGNKNSIPYILSVSGIDYDSWEDLDDDYGLYEVDPDTVGQYTGLTDKNGKKIFEGDIIKIFPDCDYLDDYDISKVYSYNGIFCVDYHVDDFDSTALGFLESYIPDCAFEIIGNIHDNPELLEVRE